MIGDRGCGKTSIIARFTKGEFNENTKRGEPTFASLKTHKEVELDSHIVSFCIYDNADLPNQKRAALMIISHYIPTVILVFDVTEQASFDAIQEFY